MQVYGDEVKDAADASDFLFRVQQAGRTTVAQVASTLGNVASIAKLAGIELNDLGSMFSLITRTGISTEETVTALRGLIQGFTKSTADAKKAAKEYGVTLSVTSLQGENLIPTLEKLVSLNAEQLSQVVPNIRD